jgi:hypothetical protein
MTRPRLVTTMSTLPLWHRAQRHRIMRVIRSATLASSSADASAAIGDALTQSAASRRRARSLLLSALTIAGTAGLRPSASSGEGACSDGRRSRRCGWHAPEIAGEGCRVNISACCLGHIGTWKLCYGITCCRVRNGNSICADNQPSRHRSHQTSFIPSDSAYLNCTLNRKISAAR